MVRKGDEIDTRAVFEFIAAHQAEFPVATMCRVLEGSTSGYYKWRRREPSKRAQEDQVLTEKIKQVHVQSRGTYVPTGAGFLYLAVVLDAFSWHIVGWAMANHLRKELVISALEMALGQRNAEGVIHHSDRGSQYTSIAFGARCEEVGIQPSMGTSCFDNALCESFFATLECELIDRKRFRTRAEARMAIFRFVEGGYNPHRRHSALDYESPMKYEQKYLAEVVDRKLQTVH